MNVLRLSLLSLIVINVVATSNEPVFDVPTATQDKGDKEIAKKITISCCVVLGGLCALAKRVPGDAIMRYGTVSFHKLTSNIQQVKANLMEYAEKRIKEKNVKKSLKRLLHFDLVVMSKKEIKAKEIEDLIPYIKKDLRTCLKIYHTDPFGHLLDKDKKKYGEIARKHLMMNNIKNSKSFTGWFNDKAKKINNADFKDSAGELCIYLVGVKEKLDRVKIV